LPCNACIVVLISVKATMNDKYYTPQEIAKILKVSYMTVYRWIQSGKLQAYQVQKQYRIREADFNSFMQSNRKFSSKSN